MHFLCLHGIGTNNQVFKAQTAAIRYELGDQHTYEFVEGTIPWPMAPEISPLFDPGNQYYAYFDPNSPSTAIEALNHLNEYVSIEGPFDGVLTFSQGAFLAAMHIIRKAQEARALNSPPPFKCAIFFSIGKDQMRDPKALAQRGEVRPMVCKADDHPIRIPTVHIWGRQEKCEDQVQLFHELCSQDCITKFVHDGGHEIPGLGVNSSVVDATKAIRQAIFRATSL